MSLGNLKLDISMTKRILFFKEEEMKKKTNRTGNR